MRESLRTASLGAAIILCGCASVDHYLSTLSGRQSGPPPLSAYAPTPFASAFDAGGKPGERIRIVTDFQTLEETILDLPDQYHSGWLRLAASDPTDPQSKSTQIVAPDRYRRMFDEFKPGQRLDLLAVRTMAADQSITGGERGAVVLRVERFRKHVPESPAPPPPPQPAVAAAPAPLTAPPAPLLPAAAPAQGALTYLNKRNAEERLVLNPDGTFQLRDRGKDLTGRYELHGDRIALLLANGRRAFARRDGPKLIDPDGREWSLEPLTK